MLRGMRQPQASGGRWRTGTLLAAQSWDRTSGRMVLIALDAATWIYVVVVAQRALFG
jgi:hypothetical protein